MCQQQINIKGLGFARMASCTSPIKERLRAYSASKKNVDINSVSKGDSTQKDREEEPHVDMAEVSQVSIPEKFSTENIETLLRNLTDSVNGIKTDLADLRASKSKVLTIETEQQNLTSTVKTCPSERESDAFKIKLLTAIVIRQDEKISAMSKEIELIKKDSKKVNLFWMT